MQKQAQNWVRDIAALQAKPQFCFPLIQPGFTHFAGWRFIDEVVGSAAKPIDSVGSSRQFFGEKLGSKVKTFRPSFSGFLGLEKQIVNAAQRRGSR
jgi:hypothetical protein